VIVLYVLISRGLDIFLQNWVCNSHSLTFEFYAYSLIQSVVL